MTSAVRQLKPKGGTKPPVTKCYRCQQPAGTLRPRMCDRCAQAELDGERDTIRSVTERRLVWPMPDGDWARLGNRLFEERIHKRMQSVAAKWTPERGNLVVIGKSGLGKTFGFVALAHRLIDEAIKAAKRSHPIVLGHWTDCYSLVASVRRHGLGDGLPPEVTLAMEASILFLDELGHEPSGRDAYDPILWELVDTRYRRGRITLVTSGSRRSELEGRYGAAFVRRLIEPKGTVLDLWEDS